VDGLTFDDANQSKGIKYVKDQILHLKYKKPFKNSATKQLSFNPNFESILHKKLMFPALAMGPFHNTMARAPLK
jgi:hypothetical protein